MYSTKNFSNRLNSVSEQRKTAITMTMAMPSSSSSSKRGGLLGPRPQLLKVSSPPPSTRPSKKTHGGGAGPVIVYEHTPKVVHARPHEFMTVVQRLTGKPAATSSMHSPGFSPALAEEGASQDPLLLTLGQRQAAAPLPSPMAAGMLMSPGFICSPNTMQSFQELSPLF